jgi:hypothetical protein
MGRRYSSPLVRPRTKVGIVVATAILLAGGMMVPFSVRTPLQGQHTAVARPRIMDLSAYSPAPPGQTLRLLFIHHSCGGQLLALEGTDDGQSCIYRTHSNGGGLRAALEHDGYEVHEASYGSEIGENTEPSDWLPKFRDKFDKISRLDHQDRLRSDHLKNQIVVFKSCFTASRFTGEGTPPGVPTDPVLTVSNARAALSALLPEFARHPEVLFVYVTAPPLAPKLPSEPLWKWGLKALTGRGSSAEQMTRSADLARAFNSWVVAIDGWLAPYAQRNVVVFDYYDELTEHGASNMSRYATGDGSDSHPSALGNARAARVFLPLLNRAVRRAGLVAEPKEAGDSPKPG